MKKRSGLAKGYIHGFTKHEQDRLLAQARVHEDVIFSKVDFTGREKLLEVGSGVGAQTHILLERYPNAHIDCVDASEAQVKRARQLLAKEIKAKRLAIHQADALDLPFKDDSFDGAFICWLLEHVPDPVAILAETRRTLRSGGVLYCNEVLNATFYLHPYSPATMKFWFEFNDHQWSLKGDPFVGGKLANYMMDAGFQNVSTQVLTHQYDNRTPKKRAAFIDYWTNLLLSAAPDLIKAKKIPESLAEEMRDELQKLKAEKDSVIFYSWILARGEAY